MLYEKDEERKNESTKEINVATSAEAELNEGRRIVEVVDELELWSCPGRRQDIFLYLRKVKWQLYSLGNEAVVGLMMNPSPLLKETPLHGRTAGPAAVEMLWGPDETR